MRSVSEVAKPSLPVRAAVLSKSLQAPAVPTFQVTEYFSVWGESASATVHGAGAWASLRVAVSLWSVTSQSAASIGAVPAAVAFLVWAAALSQAIVAVLVPS